MSINMSIKPMRKIGRLEYEVSKTVLYVRTVETSDTRRGDDEWMLPDHIEAESEIRKLESVHTIDNSRKHCIIESCRSHKSSMRR